jgi:hypothetical protein
MKSGRARAGVPLALVAVRCHELTLTGIAGAPVSTDKMHMAVERRRIVWSGRRQQRRRANEARPSKMV